MSFFEALLLRWSKESSPWAKGVHSFVDSSSIAVASAESSHGDLGMTLSRAEGM